MSNSRSAGLAELPLGKVPNPQFAPVCATHCGLNAMINFAAHCLLCVRVFV